MSHTELKLWAEARFIAAKAAHPIFKDYAVQFENVPFEVPLNQNWMAFTVLSSPFPGKHFQLGKAKMIRYDGFVVIDCLQPDGTGELDVIDMQEWAADLFSSVTVRLNGGDSVKFDAPALTHFGCKNGWMRKIAKIGYKRDVFN